MLDVTISLQSSLQMQAVLLSSQATASVGWRWAITLNIPLRFHATLDVFNQADGCSTGGGIADGWHFCACRFAIIADTRR